MQCALTCTHLHTWKLQQEELGRLLNRSNKLNASSTQLWSRSFFSYPSPLSHLEFLVPKSIYVLEQFVKTLDFIDHGLSGMSIFISVAVQRRNAASVLGTWRKDSEDLGWYICWLCNNKNNIILAFILSCSYGFVCILSFLLSLSILIIVFFSCSFLVLFLFLLSFLLVHDYTYVCHRVSRCIVFTL